MPPGLLGVFLAAMFAATMSALDTVYNMVASVLSRDMYMHFKPKTSDKALIGIGRWMTVACGGVTILLCLYYINGTSDLFTVMVDIFYLSAPVMAVPVLMGFLFRSAPRSAGMACIIWGVATGFVTKLCLGWDYGPQIYLTQSVCIAIFLSSRWLGDLWNDRENRDAVGILAVVFTALILGVMLLGTPENVAVTGWLTTHQVIVLYAEFMLLTMILFARWFSKPEDRTEVDRFYRDLDTPVDVATEVTGSKEAALTVFRLVGVVTALIGGGVLVLMGVEMLMDSSRLGEWWKYVALSAILFVLAALFYLPGRLEKPDAA